MTDSLLFIEWIRQPWHWAAGGAGIAAVVFLMTWMGRSFGISTSFKDICSLAGADKVNDFFKMDLKEEMWRLLFVLGIIIGSYMTSQWLRSPEPVAISQSTIDYLAGKGIAYPEADANDMGFFPTSFFNFSNLKGILLAIVGGFLVGFGSRYGGGCTSGHAITGLSHLQLPSLLTVVGFFIGGLIMVHFILPFLF